MTSRVLALLALPLSLATLAAATTDPNTPAGTAVTSKIRKVVVYSDRARITRTGSVALKETRQRVYIPDLPAALDDGSVSANFPGTKSAKILSIEVETAYGTQTSKKDAEALIEKGKDLDRKLRAADDDLAAMSAEESFLRSFQVKTRPDEKGRPVPVTLDPLAWQQTLSFVSDGLSNVLARERARQKERLDLQKSRDALESDLQKIRSYQSQATKRIALEIEGGSGNADVEVTYAIAGPSWRPAYDVRVLSSTGKVEVVTNGVIRQQTGEDWKDVDLVLSTASPDRGAQLPELLAWRLGDAQEFAVASANGDVGAMGAGLADKESESSVETVASARDERKSRPSRHSAPKAEAPAPTYARAPEPMPAAEAEEMDAPPPPPPPPSAGPRGGAYGASAAAQGGVAYRGKTALDFDDVAIEGNLKKPQLLPPPAVIRAVSGNVWSLPAGHAYTFVNAPNAGFSWSGDVLRCPSPMIAAGGFDYAFKPPRKVTVLSDARERKVKLTTTQFPAELLYEVVAPVSTKAYLRATMTNASKQPFLAGESFVFLDDDFVGRAFVNTVAPNDKLELSLGIDEDVKVERHLEQTAETSGVFSKKEKTNYSVNVTIKSFKKRQVAVLLRDHVPITWQKDDISIGDVKLSPEPLSEKEGSAPAQGLFAWKLTLPAGGKQDVKIRYTVEHPRDFDLVETRGN